MKRARKSNRVSWAPGLNLCQVRLFVSEDCPSQLGNEGQDNLKTKSSNSQPSQHCKDKGSNELPPGFERPYLLRKPLKPNSSHIPSIPWNCPPKFCLSYNWNVVAGEESQEVVVQKLRESRVLEAFYPNPASIPANSSVSVDVEGECYDDSLTPSIPIIPIEEEEESANVPPSLPEPALNSLNSQLSSLHQALLPSSSPNSAKCNASAEQSKPSPGMLPGQDTCLVTAAAIAVMKSKEQGSLVDTDLLIKILSDPKMVLELVNDFQRPTITASAQTVVSKPATHFTPPSFTNAAPGSAPFAGGRNSDNRLGNSQLTSTPPSWPKPAMAAETDAVRVSGKMPPALSPSVGNLISSPNQVQANLNTAPSLESTVAKSSLVGTNSNPFLGSGLISNQPSTEAQTCISSIKTNHIKDINYIKNLIREHGTEKSQDRSIAQKVSDHNNMRPREVKFQKACFYFKTPKGCRNGSNCPYQHDFSFQLQSGTVLDAPPPLKRMRLRGEIAGRT